MVLFYSVARRLKQRAPQAVRLSTSAIGLEHILMLIATVILKYKFAVFLETLIFQEN